MRGQRAQRRVAYGVGGNYRLAPGLDLRRRVQQLHRCRAWPRARPLTTLASQDKATAKVFIIGTRLAF